MRHRETVFDDLYRDMRDFGIFETTPRDIAPWPVLSYESAMRLVKCTKYTGNATLDDRLLDFAAASPRTEIGARMQTLAAEGTFFETPTATYNCCSEAEWRLMRNLGTNSIRRSGYVSPIIVTCNDEPCGIIKTDNKMSCYGLGTVTYGDICQPLRHKRIAKEYRLIEGVFSSPAPNVSLDWLPLTSRPLKLPIDYLGEMQPMRFGMFSLPLGDREALLSTGDFQKVALKTTHDVLRKRAARLLKTAVTVEMPPMYKPIRNYLLPAGGM
jgi:hypothetical protein